MKGLLRGFFIAAILMTSACGLLVETGREKVAEVDGEPVRLNALLGRIRELPFEERARTNDQNDAVRLSARRAVLSAIVNERLLVKEAEARGIQISDEEIEAALEQEETPSEAVEAAEEGMKSASSAHEHNHGPEPHSQREIDETRQKLLVRKLLEQELSDAHAKDYYEKHIKEFELSSPVVSFEMVTANPEDGAFIDRIYEKATNEGVTLKEAFKDFEEVPPDARAVVIPPIPVEYLPSRVRAQVLPLQIGEISKPFHLHKRTTNDLNLIMPLVKEVVAPLESVREQITQGMYRDFIAGLETKYNVVYHEDMLNYKLGG